ncbi:MAG: hypothetical protein ABI652_09050 [Acidobacteriota bacterium]
MADEPGQRERFVRYEGQRAAIDCSFIGILKQPTAMRVIEPAGQPGNLVYAQGSLIRTTDNCQTNTDKPIREDRLAALGNRQEVNDTVTIAMPMKSAMPTLECGRRWRAGAEVHA